MATYCYVCDTCGRTEERDKRDDAFWRVICLDDSCSGKVRRDWKAESVNIDLTNCRAVPRGR